MKFIAENYGPAARGPAARIRDGANVFVSYRGRWEWYVVKPSDPGLEQFAGYVDDPRHVAVLNLVFQVPELTPAVDPSYATPRQRTNDWAKELIPKDERCFRLVDDPERFEVVECRPKLDLESRRRSL